ncbi:hypothetical protein K449DRAFT_398140 [Hypoxylon sp. EC38]|nr:hypothetical protein K449DRAFT_398140 [Hypoxylon sp. EC38]
MLPDSIVGCYAQYKEDTKVFTTWLGQAARACGYKLEAEKAPSMSPQAPGPSQRLKGKARKAAKEEEKQKATEKGYKDEVNIVKYAVTTEQLLLQADLVYNNKANIRIPSAIKDSLKRAINMRRRCSDWYEETNQNNERIKNGHRRFIEVLETVLEKLDANANQENIKGNRKTGAKPARADKASIELQNRFSQLTVDEIDNSFDLTATQVAISTTKQAKGQQPRSVDVFELEAEKELDNIFAIFCFLEYSHRIKDHVEQAWDDHRSGTISFVAASIITHAAMCGIRREEEDVCAIVFSKEPNDVGFIKMLQAMSPVLFKLEGPVSNEKFQPVNPDTLSAFGFLFTPFILLKAITTPNDPWPPHITPLSLLQLMEPETRDLPEIKNEIQQDQILSQLLVAMAEMDLIEKHLVELGNDTPSLGNSTQEDIFTSTMRPLWKGKMTVASIVASQIILDVLEINDYAPAFHEKLMDFHAYAHESLDFGRLEDGQILTARHIKWPQSSINLLLEIYEALLLIRCAGPEGPRENIPHEALTYENAHVMVKTLFECDCKKKGIELGSPEELSEKIRAQNLRFIEEAPEPNFAMLQNPLYLGALAFKLAIQYEEAGIIAANAHLSVFTCAHIYNALRQLCGMSLKWPVMEAVIEAQKRPIFANSIPTTVAAIMNRISLRRKDTEKAKFDCRPCSEAFRSLLADKDTPAKALYPIEEYIESVESKAQSDARATKRAPRTRKGPRNFTADRLLNSLQEHVPQMLDEMSIDYACLTKRCNRLILEIMRLHVADLEARGIPNALNLDRMSSENKKLSVKFLGLFLKDLRTIKDAGATSKRLGARSKREETSSQGSKATDEELYGSCLSGAHKVFKKFLAEEDIEFRVPLIMAGSP